MGKPRFKSLCTKVENIAVYGFALDQWIALREVLVELDSKLRFASLAGLEEAHEIAMH